MASGNTIIIGGGIAGASPFTIGQFPVIVLTDPKTVTDGNIRQDTSTPPKVYIGQSTYSATSTVFGGATANAFIGASVVIGEAASSLPSSAITNPNVVIGAAAIGGTSNVGGNVVIGASATALGAGATSNDAVVIGRGANLTSPGAGNSSVVIGAGAGVTLGSSLVLIGAAATWAANNIGVIVGANSAVSGGAGVANCVLVGPNISTNKTRNILIGAFLVDASTASGNLAIIGNSWTSSANMPSNACGFLNSAGFTTMIVGNSHEAAVPGSLTFRLCNGLGANVAAGSLTLQAGLGTGTGASAVINLASSIPVGAGSTLQTSRTGFRMSPSVTAGQTDIMIYDVDNATLERVTVGAADSGGVGFKLLRIPN